MDTFDHSCGCLSLKERRGIGGKQVPTVQGCSSAAICTVDVGRGLSAVTARDRSREYHAELLGLRPHTGKLGRGAAEALQRTAGKEGEVPPLEMVEPSKKDREAVEADVNRLAPSANVAGVAKAVPVCCRRQVMLYVLTFKLP
jgi:hypothetical protein